MTYQISDIEKMLEEITPGEWGVDALGYIRGENGESILDRIENVPFVEAAPSIVRQLLKELSESRAVIEELLARMKLINGDDKNCVVPLDCPNHKAIKKAKRFLERG